MNKISIITINRNNAEGLEKTIKSVIEQTYTNYEFIVIDGASTDLSLEVIERYKEKISFYVSEPDSGIYNAMNKGILRSLGDYCYFLNSGDKLFSDSTLDFVFKNTTYTAPFVIGHQVNDYKFDKWRIDCPNKLLTLYDLYFGTVKHQATFIKRDLFDTYGLYDETLKITSDWKFFLQTIGLHNEQPTYVDVDVVLFEWEGISTNEVWGNIQKEEREKVLSSCLPVSIRQDYQRLRQLSHYDFIAQKMEKNKLFNSFVRGLYKLFK